MKELLKKINDKKAQVGIIGLGYVGLPIAVEASLSGFNTLGFDVIKEKVDLLNEGKNYIDDVNDEQLKSVVQTKKMRSTTDFSQIKNCDIILICVPTPLDKYYQPDVNHIINASQEIATYLKKDTLVVLESTTYPGTTEEIIKPLLEKNNRKLGSDFYLAFSPERVDPGNMQYKTKNIPKVIGGCTENCSKLAASFYSLILSSKIHIVSSPAVAEMEKLLENTFRMVNIGLVNEMSVLCNKMKINIWEVIEAAKTKPYGFMPFYPGPGLGGHCIPIDPFYLTWKAKEFHFQTTLIEAAGFANRQMPEYVVEKIGIILNSINKCYKQATILILGIAYKKDISDYRESPALMVLELLKERECIIKFADPHIKSFIGHDRKVYHTEELTDSLLAKADITVIITDHSQFNEEQIINKANLIYDTRNFIKKASPKLISL